MCSDRQAARIHSLAETLGRSAAQCVVSELLVGRSKTDVLDGCIFGDLTAKLAEAKNRTWITSFVRSPLQLACYLLSDAIRRIQRWRTPTGLLVVVVGPDGTGKSTLIRHLVQATGPAFRRSRVFHWRPMLLWRRRVSRDTTRPHCNPLHGASWSVVRLLAYLVDYWLGYSTLVRPSIARSGLVVFDRYFDDMWIDPKRYRYGGPVWLVKALRRFIPKADVTLVLDADEDTLLTRKQELPRAELSRQRRLYRDNQSRPSIVHVVDASAPIEEVKKQAVDAILTHLHQRFERQHARWYQCPHS